jgi:DNA-binding MarR family transcriptional regulator
LEELILEVLDKQSILSISEIGNILSANSSSSISTTITKLWKDKSLVNKNISPDNQRVTLVDLTHKGQKALENIRKDKTELYASLKTAMALTPEEDIVIRRVIEKAVSFFDTIIFETDAK